MAATGSASWTTTWERGPVSSCSARWWPRGCTTPIILLTGNDDWDVDVEAMEAGAADYLVKGQFGTRQLERSIRYAMGLAVERQKTLEALRRSQERYALAVRGANDGLWDWDLTTDRIYYAPRWKSMLGYGTEQIGDSPQEWFSRVHPLDLERVKAEVSAHLAGKSSHLETEHRMLHDDGTYRWVLTRGLAVRDDQGKVVRMAGSQSDITRRKAAEYRLQHDAFHDSLTDLPNRALLMDRLSQAVARTKRRPDSRFAVLFLDIDGFKYVNDSLGHQMGDQLLIAISRRLEACIRDGRHGRPPRGRRVHHPHRRRRIHRGSCSASPTGSSQACGLRSCWTATNWS